MRGCCGYAEELVDPETPSSGNEHVDSEVEALIRLELTDAEPPIPVSEEALMKYHLGELTTAEARVITSLRQTYNSWAQANCRVLLQLYKKSIGDDGAESS